MNFDGYQRPVVKNAIREVCVYRRYELFALQARTIHFHCVTFSADKPAMMINLSKSYSTRRLRENNLISPDQKVWSRHGSRNSIWAEKHIKTAIDYVVNG